MTTPLSSLSEYEASVSSLVRVRVRVRFRVRVRVRARGRVRGVRGRVVQG